MRGEDLRIIRSVLSELTPQIVFHAPHIDLGFEHRAQAFALSVVIDTGQVNDGEARHDTVGRD
jgi:hypothetical protein